MKHAMRAFDKLGETEKATRENIPRKRKRCADCSDHGKFLELYNLTAIDMWRKNNPDGNSMPSRDELCEYIKRNNGLIQIYTLNNFYLRNETDFNSG